MMGEFVFASSNGGKLTEVRSVATEFGYQVIDPLDLKARCGDAPLVDENADSYQANARLKAIAYQRWSANAVLADDTGLEVAAINGSPGLYSARYAGEHATATENLKKLLRELEYVDKRGARFICSLVMIAHDGQIYESRGELNGEITRVPNGAGGFGYDGIFFIPQLGCTLAEAKSRNLSIETHRTIALRRLFQTIASG